MTPQWNWIFLAIVFFSVLMVCLAVTYVSVNHGVRDRVNQLAGADSAEGLSTGWVERFVKVAGPIARLSIPEDGWENSPLRIRFMNAGFRGRAAPIVFFATKTLLAFLLPFPVFLYISLAGIPHGTASLMLLLTLVGAAGYYAPNFVLAHIRTRRQRDIVDAFPDALDLMTICVEAGLGLDAALLRVADEIALTGPKLAEELHLVTLEMRAGSSKDRALRNLALRTGVEDVDMLVAMLLQAERFGTSVGDSLRMHSENLRIKRRQRAEERAAKIPVLQLFPLIFCIFPSMLVVLMGPSVLRIAQEFSFILH